MTNDDKEIYGVAKQAHRQLYTLISKLTAEITAGCGGSLTTLADHAYALREVAALCDDVRKEASALQDVAGRIACILWTQITTEHPHMLVGGDKNIKTDYCTATPDCKMAAKFPTLAKDPEAYFKMMDFLGVSRDLLGDAEGKIDEAIRPHWPGMITLLSNLAKEGKPVPPGVDVHTQYPIYKLHVRKRKDVDGHTDRY